MNEKTYIIFMSGYALDGESPTIREFKGTWRDLLYHLLDIAGDDEPFDQREDDSDILCSEVSEDQLKEMFDYANGDGLTYKMVWCVEDHKQVIE